MESVKIEKLLERYFEAATSLEEERNLREYFSGEEVADHLVEYKELFNYFSNSSLESSKRSIDLRRRTIPLQWLSIAAMLVFFLGIYSVYRQNETQQEEARLAYMETQKALDLISRNLNKGTGAIAQLETFNKGTAAIAQLQNFEEAQNKVFSNK